MADYEAVPLKGGGELMSKKTRKGRKGSKSRRKRKANTLHFKNKRSYQKWLAYNWIHNRSKMGKPPHKRVIIAGKPHRVKHPR
jgi:hypothetical protein